MLFPHFISILRYLVVFSTLPSFVKCGALLNRLSCVSLRPVGGVVPAEGANPFTATASPSSYTPGMPIQITINAANGETFSGMILQARVNGSMTPIGSFSPTNGFVNFDCGGDTFATLTDDGSTATRTLPLVFTWNPPNFIIGRSININIAIVRDGVFWWLKLRILIVFQIGCNAGMCQNGGTCEIVQPNDEVYCMCPPPFTGPLCTDCATTPCDSSSCPAGASCIPDSNCNSYRCGSIMGSECATCGQDPCLNGGVCVHDTSLPYSFRCECPEGLVGEICDTVELNIPVPPPAPAPAQRFVLLPNIRELVDNGDEHCLVFIAFSRLKVRLILQGYIFTYGNGRPRENPRRPILPLIVDAFDTFWICLKRIRVTFFELDIRALVVRNDHQVGPVRPQPEYRLPPGLFNMITNGDIDCIECTVNVLTQVNINNIQGFDFCYGTGVPLQNKQNNGPLVVPAGGTFWFCLEPINPLTAFMLNLQ